MDCQSVNDQVDVGDSQGLASPPVHDQGVGGSGPADRIVDGEGGSRFDVRNLLPGGIKVNHLKELQEAAKFLDQLRRNNDPIQTEELTLAELKLNLSLAESIDEMVLKLGSNEEAMSSMARLVEERVLEELLTLGAGEKGIKLSEWPNSQKENFFVEVVKLAHQRSPITLAFLLKLILKDNSSNVQPSHVVSVATVFSTLAHLVDKSNNVLQKINSMQLKLDGLSDEGLDAQACLGLTVTARTMRHARDEFAEVSEECLIEQTKTRPDQSTMDNCDQKGSHTTVEYREIEFEDTSHLDVDAMAPEDVQQLFNVDLLLLGSESLKDEREHLERIILNETGKVLSQAMPDELGHWTSLLPKHHSHPFSHLKLREAAIMLRPPHYKQVRFVHSKLCSTVLSRGVYSPSIFFRYANNSWYHCVRDKPRNP